MIAAMALQGLLANPNQNIEVWDPGLTDVAVGYADDLIRRLNGELPPRRVTVPEAHKPRQEPAPAQAGPSPNLRDLGVSGRACAPLERMGVETLAQLAVQSRSDISKVRGVSVETLKQFDDLLAKHGLTWDYQAPEPGDETTPEDEGEEDEDDLL